MLHESRRPCFIRTWFPGEVAQRICKTSRIWLRGSKADRIGICQGRLSKAGHVSEFGEVFHSKTEKHFISGEGAEQEDSYSDRLCLIPHLFHHQSKHQPEIDTLFPINGFNTCSAET